MSADVRRSRTVRYARYAAIVAGLSVWVHAAHAQRPVAATQDGIGADRSAEALLARQITLTLTNVSLKRAVDSVSRVANVLIQYQLPLITAYTKPVSLRLVNTPLGVALERVLDGSGLRMVSDGQGSFLIVASQDQGKRDSVPASGAITGRVVDSATGRGLSGVTIKVAGTKIVVQTQDSGRFVLRNVAVGQQLLTAKIFGYRPAEQTVDVTAAQMTAIRVALSSVPTVLSGVVTTATGVQRKIEVGNDITTLNVDSVMRVAPIMSVTDLLETRVPGLTVLHSSGVPGDPSRLRLRGAGSITLNNDPIVIVDGVRIYASQSDPRNNNLAPSQTGGTNKNGANFQSSYAAPSPIDQIDPNNIATIEVFKGPSASALYGSDAANGVIVITTKQGRAGPAHWSLTLGQGVNHLPGNWPTNIYRFDVIDSNYSVPCNWYAVDCTANANIPFQALNDSRYTVFATGSDRTADLAVSGGVPALTYNLSGSVAGDVGNLKLPGIERQRYEALYGPIPHWMLRPDNYTTWSGAGSLTAQPSSTMQVTVSSNLFNSAQQRSSLEGAIAQLEGSYISPLGFVSSVSSTDFDLSTTPLISGDVERATAGSLTSTNAIALSWQPRPWLPLTGNGGISTVQRTDNTYIPYGVNACGAGQVLGPGCDTTGSFGLGRGSSHVQTFVAGTTIPLFHQHLAVAVGGNVYSGSTADFQAYTNQLAPGVSVPTGFPTTGTGVKTSFTQTTSAASTYGWYFEPRLNISSRFFAAPGFRLDGGSGGSHATTSGGSVGGLSGFPKLDFSWVAVDRQDARPLWGVLTLLRPRLAFGLAGTQPGPADRLRLINTNGNGQTVLPISDTSTVPVAALSTLGNTQLRPERSSELEGGFDAEFWHGRVSMTYSQYNKTRRDAIISIPVAPSVAGSSLGSVGSFVNGTFGYVGFNTNYDKNIGTVRNTGLEFSVNAQPLVSRALSWNVGATMSTDKNVLVRLNPGQPPFCLSGDLRLGGTCLVPGFPLFGEWERPIAGFADVNHDGRIETNEILVADSAVYVGQSEPKYQLALNTGVTLLDGRLSVNATFDYQNGMTQKNQGAFTSGGFALVGNAENTPLATQAAVLAGICTAAALYCPGQDGFNIGTGFGLVQTVSTLRFNALSVNYQVPQAIASAFRVPRISVALQGSNLALHSNYRGKDPGVNAFSTVSAGDEAADTGQIPEPRTWWLKMTLGN